MRFAVIILFSFSFLIAQKQEAKKETTFQIPLSVQSIYQFGEPFNSNANYVGLGASTQFYSASETIHFLGLLHLNYLSIPLNDSNQLAEKGFLIEGGLEAHFELDKSIFLIAGTHYFYGFSDEAYFKSAELSKTGLSVYPGVGIRLNEKLNIQFRFIILENTGFRFQFDYRLF